MMKLWETPSLRFSQGDRVLCNVGPCRLAGTILSCDVEDPEDPDPRERLPYVIKTDALPGVAPSRTISAPSDVDEVICRDRCFSSIYEKDLAKWAAPPKIDKSKPLRYGLGDAVAIRVMDNDEGFEQWMDGKITEGWPALPGHRGQELPFGLMPAESVPYLVSLKANPDRTFFCHRDDHTLIRKPGISQKHWGRQFQNALRSGNLTMTGLKSLTT